MTGILIVAIIVPLEKLALKKGLAKNKSKINTAVRKGYFVPEEQNCISTC